MNGVAQSSESDQQPACTQRATTEEIGARDTRTDEINPTARIVVRLGQALHPSRSRVMAGRYTSLGSDVGSVCMPLHKMYLLYAHGAR